MGLILVFCLLPAGNLCFADKPMPGSIRWGEGAFKSLGSLRALFVGVSAGPLLDRNYLAVEVGGVGAQV